MKLRITMPRRSIAAGAIRAAAPRTGCAYVGSWIDANFDRFFQLMECDDARPLQQWVAFWGDLVEFEIVPVVPSTETREMIEPLL
jgi:Protein of unknown function (DUF3303)